MQTGLVFYYRRLALILLVVVFYLLHQDFWWWNDARPFLFGFLPLGLAYHALYSVAASALMALLVKKAWPKDLEGPEA